MKRTFVSVTVCVFVCSCAFAQNQNSAFNWHDTFKYESSSSTIPSSSTTNFKARQNFASTYKNINNETWFPASDGFIANFLLDGKDYRVAYKENGQWKYTELTYSEEKLPRSIRETVRREFYHYDIEYCSEFITSNFKAHIITMTNRETKSMIKVQVAEGEMMVIVDREKSGKD